jgi:hypothetical protein
MLKKTVKKGLWKGQYVSIRDYELEEGKRRGGIEITHKGKVMTLGVDRLNILQPSGRIFQSKFGGKNYRLVDVVFEEDVVNENQGNLNL